MKDLNELILVLGGSSSGKSAFAESLSCASENNYYLATMKRPDIRDAYYHEIMKRIETHRKSREGKGFITLEIERDIEAEAKKAIEGRADLILLESLSSLLSNEMFNEDIVLNERSCEEKIFAAIELLLKKTGRLVIVSDEIFSDGIIYEEPASMYQRCLSALHEKIAKEAAAVYEVYYGIPRRLK
ncbi:MAG: bifunctional adenosylcobinamide kinase/adenosylcobinamide-phosphate guanylyltransferase [Lachnospiraceae bacterium]|nr:bifunctional adenosylcobinamide kinase/adenosylcobinamide-phosphate guanylyltransferase [Lachnospiraceae bacterium]